MNAFVKLSASALVLSLALAAPLARAADNAPAAAPTAAPAAAPAVTPANDPAYTYKTLRLNRAAVDAVLSKPEQALILDVRRPDELDQNRRLSRLFEHSDAATCKRALASFRMTASSSSCRTARIAPAPLAIFSTASAIMSSARLACWTIRMKAAC